MNFTSIYSPNTTPNRNNKVKSGYNLSTLFQHNTSALNASKTDSINDHHYTNSSITNHKIDSKNNNSSNNEEIHLTPNKTFENNNNAHYSIQKTPPKSTTSSNHNHSIHSTTHNIHIPKPSNLDNKYITFNSAADENNYLKAKLNEMENIIFEEKHKYNNLKHEFFQYKIHHPSPPRTTISIPNSNLKSTIHTSYNTDVEKNKDNMELTGITIL